MPDSTEKADMERIQKALDILSEHFDSVQIFASRHEPATEDGTIAATRGFGNWYARYGQIAQWMDYHQEMARLQARSSPD